MPATLANIRTKVRRLTRSPSITQITDAQLDEYINDFLLYDFPHNVHTFNKLTLKEFFLEPNIDIYQSSNIIGSPLYQFDQIVISIHPPIYINYNQAFFSQSQEEFWNLYPQTVTSKTEATGDGVTQVFNGVLTTIPILRYRTSFVSIDAFGNKLVLKDDGEGTLIGDGTGLINYTLGNYDLTFNIPPGNGKAITSQVVPYVAGVPTSILYAGGAFYVRPVPDKPYRVLMQVYKRPLSLNNVLGTPEMLDWWQYIAYGATKKIFEDRSDMDSVAKIMPEFENQECLVLRRTWMQLSNERAPTIYSNATVNGMNNWWFNNIS